MIRRVCLVVALSVAALAGAAAQNVVTPIAGPVPAPPNVRPTTRQVPVGTAELSGTVTAADTGRPIRGARVTLSTAPVVPDVPATGRATIAAPARGTPAPFGVTATSSTSTVTSLAGVSRTAATDANGQFSFAWLPGGSYRISVSRQQYLAVNYGQRKFGRQGADIPLTDGQRLALKIALPRGGVIAGTVFDENGDPAAGAQVRVLRFGYQNGVKRPMNMNGATADDRGMYRIVNLQPGEYIVSATPSFQDTLNDPALADEAALTDAIAAAQRASGGRPVTLVTLPVPQGPRVDAAPTGFLPTYSPGTGAVASATRVTLDPGEERDGQDVRLIAARAGGLTGTVMGMPAAGVPVQITAVNEDATADQTTSSNRLQPNGRFTLQNLAPGRYTVLAQTVAPPPPPPVIAADGRVTSQPPLPQEFPRLWAEATVEVTGPTFTDVVLALQPGRSISGRVTYDMQRPPGQSGPRPTVMLAPAPAAQSFPSFGPQQQSQVGTDGRFTIAGVAPGRYLLRIAAPGGFERSAVVNGIDTLDSALVMSGDDVNDVEITVTDRLSSLSGALTLASGAAASDYTIILAASDSRYWTPNSRRVLSMATRSAGKYLFANVPPGDYMLAAVTDLEQGAQYDPDFLKAIAGASVHVTIADGVAATQDLRTTR